MAMEQPLTANLRPGEEPLALREYQQTGGYQAAREALGRMSPLEVRELVRRSGLRGRSSGMPTGAKWSSMPPDDDPSRPSFLVANAHEMEPGVFKDRLLLEGDPHQLIEGIIVASHALQADVAYIFLRAEYRTAAERLDRAIAEAYEGGLLGGDILGSGHNLELRLRMGAGRYICGEESAVLSALEGKRPIPRAQPPLPRPQGLWGRPTVVNSVETLCNLPHIVARGAEWFRGLSRSPEEGGTRIYGVSGKVRAPGAWELPVGTPMREIIEQQAGGMVDGLELRGVQPGGGSTPFLVEEHLDLPMDCDSIRDAGSRLGAGSMVLLDGQSCPVGTVLNLAGFFARESCGWCTPCREGLPWVVELLRVLERGQASPGELELLEEQVGLFHPGSTFCPMGLRAVEVVKSALLHFRSDFERHIQEKRCPRR